MAPKAAGYEAPATPAALADSEEMSAVATGSRETSATAAGSTKSKVSASQRSGNSKTRLKKKDEAKQFSGGEQEKTTAEEREAEQKQKEEDRKRKEAEREAEQRQKEADRLAKEKQKEVLKLISQLFNLANKGKIDAGDSDAESEDEGTKGAAQALAAAKAQAKASAKKGGWGSMFGKKMDDREAAKVAGQENAGGEKLTLDTGGGKVPDTFDTMIRFNAGMTGVNMQFVEIMLRNFSQIIADICSIGTLQEQTDFLAMEIRVEVTGPFKTAEFRSVLMTSLAALLPKQWNTRAEQAWAWFWDSLDRQLQESMRHVKVHERPTTKYIASLEKLDYDMIGDVLWKNLFAQEKEAELLHKQPTQTFIRISTLALQFTAKVFEDPYRMKQEIGQHALKHILHQVDIRLFGVFVVLMEDEIRSHSQDEATVAAVTWTLSVIASLMARVIKQAANPVLTAAVKNDVKGLKKALGEIGRKDRTMATLAA